ncbi:WD40 repeat domain-containing protein [Spirillospora sp. CA-108201]
MSEWHDGGGRRRGRPVKDRAQTPQARALATWLRERVTSGLTNRQLADRVPVYGHAKWAEFRNGADVIPRHVLELLLRTVVPEPRLREQLLAEGDELMERAEQAAAGKLAVSAQGLPEQELLHRLNQAQQAQSQARNQMLLTHTLVSMLLSVLHNAQQQNRALRAEVDHQQRRAARMRVESAQKCLRAAREARDEAEDLHLDGYAQAEQYRRLLGEDRGWLELPAALTTPGVQRLSERECDRLLDETAGVLLQVRQTLHDIRELLGLPDRGPSIVHGQVVDNSESPALSGRPPPGWSPPAAVIRSGPALPEPNQGRSSLPRRRFLLGLSTAVGAALLGAGDSQAHPNLASSSVRRRAAPSATSTAIGDWPDWKLVPSSTRDSAPLSLAIGTVDGTTFAISGHSDGARLWDVATRKLIGEAPGVIDKFDGTADIGWIEDVTVATVNGRTIAVTDTVVWDMSTGKRLSKYETGTTIQTAAAAERNGKIVIVFGSDEDGIRVWDPMTWELVFKANIDGGTDALACGSLDGRPIAVVASTAWKSRLHVWDLIRGKPVGKPIETNEKVRAVAVGTLAGRAIAVTGGDKSVQVWDLADRKSLGKVQKMNSSASLPVEDVAIATMNGRPIAVTSDDDVLRAWDLTTRKLVGDFHLETGGGSMAVGTMNGKTIAVSVHQFENRLLVWTLGPS